MAHTNLESDVKPLQPTGTLDRSKARHAITILRPAQEVYLFWRDFTNLPLFMKDLKSVEILSPEMSRWTVELKSGRSVEWLAEIRSEVPGQMIAWASLAGEHVETTGDVTFEDLPGGGRSVVRLAMDFALPGGAVTEWATFLTGEDPDSLALTNLKRLKQVLETGEFATIEGQPSGRDENSSYLMHH